MVICTIQARMSSGRFPGKILKELYDGKSVLEVMIERLKRSRLIDNIVILTTKNPADDLIKDFCNKKLIRYYRGDENNVLKRMSDFIDVFEIQPYDTIIDLTSDCPLVWDGMIDGMVKHFKDNKYDYLSNTITRSYPDGFDIQIYKANLIKDLPIDLPAELQQHTGWNIVNYSALLQTTCPLKMGNWPASPDCFYPDWGLTLDEPKDLLILQNIFEAMGRINFDVSEVIMYLKEHPEVLEINKEVKRKTPGVEC